MTTDDNNKNEIEVRPANKRGAARLAAVQALYQMEVGGAQMNDVLGEFEAFRLGKEMDGDQYRDADPAWFRDLVMAVIDDQRVIDPRIHQALSDDWPLRRIDATLRAILRVGAAELYRKKDVPARVIINEYIDVCKAFFEQDETRLVNGIMNRLARELRPEEFDDASKSA
ncbi:MULTISPECIES: transcription antitermination factor NusB [Pseudovibrio]|uniref:transcription antitermination factor NusB n=1 Tax=Stappiaceae TaxID=2821832 RepID=UPI002365ACB5|nr:MULTISPECIES: transcription antitermination factor NusB [Pseudovibrio]MDD7908390.1 transcription antitermination factor NusB [Pseudovibrio exalbescens]MDX5592516.1 transcription antitermination factor NusB [Pseudovibrio sp. SPO723]